MKLIIAFLLGFSALSAQSSVQWGIPSTTNGVTVQPFYFIAFGVANLPDAVELRISTTDSTAEAFLVQVTFSLAGIAKPFSASRLVARDSASPYSVATFSVPPGSKTNIEILKIKVAQLATATVTDF